MARRRGTARQPLRVSATVLTRQLRPDAERAVTATLEHLLSREVEVALEQVRVGTGAQAKAAQVAAAQSSRAAAADRLATRATEQLALVAGVAPDAVVVESLQAAGAGARTVSGNGSGGAARLRWLAPDVAE